VEISDRSFNAGVVGFRGSTQPTGGTPTDVQAALESNFLYNDKYREAKDFPNGVALLAADVSDNQLLNDNNSGSINAIISNTAIWHERVSEKG
jgi:hypothetical protein